MSNIKIIKNQPVAVFYYKGTHSSPVKRTVLITESNRNMIKGVELREGNTLRDVDEAPIKSYRLDKVATTSQLRKDNVLRDNKNKSTYSRMSLSKAEAVGF